MKTLYPLTFKGISVKRIVKICTQSKMKRFFKASFLGVLKRGINAMESVVSFALRISSILGGGAPGQGLLFAGRAFLVGGWVDMSGQHRTSKERKKE